MRRCGCVITLFVGLSLFSLAAGAQVDTLPGLILTDMQLISQESLPNWTPDWTGPIQGATIAAWFAEHGYPALMSDFNGDGVIDELDTIELADDFGRGSMRTETPRGTTDVRLVVGLGTYIGQHYPDEFVLKIYDLGFPGEYAAQGYGTFAPDVIPGILLQIVAEPSVAAYMDELSHGEGVIVGLEQGGVDRNRYLSGRSFLFEQTAEGYTPVDFAWSAEDRWQQGHQGQVLETVGKMEDRFYVEFQGDWVPVEFMLALSPIHDIPVGSETHACPDDAIAYDVTTTTLGDYGDVRVEECVVRDGDFDIYVWTVTNVSFQKDGCGLCFFRIPNPGLATVSHSELPPWTFLSAWGSWVWWLPAGSCGLQVGQSAVFIVVVPGPTTDTPVIANVGQCMPAALLVSAPPLFRLPTTGPGEPGETPGDRCPDLAIRVLDESCVYDPADGLYHFMVWTDVVNIGAVPVTSSFDVLLTGTSHPGNDTETVTVPPEMGPGAIVPVTLSFTLPPDATGGAPCPLNYELMVDSGHDIDECNESNNLVYGDICCIGEPDQGAECPDLTVQVRSVTCEMDRKNGVYIITVDAAVGNIGTETITDPIWVKAYCSRGDDSNVIHTDLDPGDWVNTEFEITFSVNEPGCPIEVTVEVDYLNFMVECDETNNTASGDACCQ